MKLPPISASSVVVLPDSDSRLRYDYQFTVHGSSGLLMLVHSGGGDVLKEVINSKHNEPEEHIDCAVDLIENALASRSNKYECRYVLGLTGKDLSLVKKFEHRFELLFDSGVLWPNCHSIEAQQYISQASTTVDAASKVLIVRHLLEHARDLDRFLLGLRNLVGLAGLCYLEVPDSTGLINHGDLTQLWEEHVYYFTPKKLRSSLEKAGFEILAERNTKSHGEDICMIVVACSETVSYCELTCAPLDDETFIFLEKLPKQLTRVQCNLNECSQNREIYLFGANHVAGFFVDVARPASRLIRIVLDDDSSKEGFVLGIDKLPIRRPAAYFDGGRVHLLVALSEGRVPKLYDRLRTCFPERNGHIVESLTSFYRGAWTDANSN